MTNKDVIKSTNYDQHALMRDIMVLHNNGEAFDCDITYSIGNFYGKFTETVERVDKDGNPIVLTKPTVKVNLSGNGSEEHKSTGLLNIFLRLREMGHAQAEIYSKEG